MANDLTADPIRALVLNTIAAGESADRNGKPFYNEIYDGGEFTGFGDHPRVRVTIPNDARGRYTTAAGRYQFISTTWDRVAKQAGLTDFSPASQDEAAWRLASETYKRKTGRELTADAAKGQAGVDWTALESEWPSLSRLNKDKVRASAAAGATGTPSLSNPPSGNALLPAAAPSTAQAANAGPDPKLALALLSMSLPKGWKAKPVDYDPFKYQQQMQAGPGSAGIGETET